MEKCVRALAHTMNSVIQAVEMQGAMLARVVSALERLGISVDNIDTTKH